MTDTKACKNRPLLALVKIAIANGVSMVQYRDKELNDRAFVETAIPISILCTEMDIPFIINDRTHLVEEIQADGVHLGQNDMTVADARSIVGDKSIIGLSVETLEQAHNANTLDVQYLGVSPVYYTSTKVDIARPLGLEGLSEIESISRHPLVGIGSINKTNAAAVMKAGASGIAVISAILSSRDVGAATREIRQIVDDCR